MPASARLRAAISAVRELDLPLEAQALRSAALEVAEIVRKLDADDDIVVAAMLRPLQGAKLIEREAAARLFGAHAEQLSRQLEELGQFGLPADWTPERPLEPGQAEALRKMLLSIVGDVRLVVVRLAEQLQRMRSAKALEPAMQRKLAIETREVYAPLANRLGVWQLKWELEDLAFRYLQPPDYKRIATALKVSRSLRERSIEELTSRLQGELAGAGILATIEGRPKHIYSIWRKMHAKQLAFEQLMDIRAARVLVDSVADCYAALGVVHSLWRFIPGEFDDYIATPKDNLYRSIHTAVIGPGGEPVEIQIRTREMHAHSERGVAAHWRYKEGGRADLIYEHKINQLRSLLAPAGGEPSALELIDRVRADLFQDRVYVLSPKGEVVDVPAGGTPLDFAYQVHTDLGHRARGAKVNGRMVALNHHLKNGETVEIIAGKAAQPSRDWLSARTGFLAGARHRGKVRAWFRRHDEAQQEGGDAAARRPDARSVRPPEAATRGRPAGRGAELEVQGFADLLSSFARCCKPVPPEPIVGYVTVGRGVSIHARNCANFARLSARAPARVLAVSWNQVGGSEFPVDIEIQAFDRRGLVRDVSAALADAKISILGMRTMTDKRDHIAHMHIGLSVSGLPQLAAVLGKIAQLTNVISAKRRK